MYIEDSKIFLSLMLACGLVIFIIAIFLYSKAQQYTQYYRLHQRIEQESLRKVEEEKKRWAADLHDNTCMEILSIQMQLSGVEANLHRHQEWLESSRQQLRRIAGHLRNHSIEITPAGIGMKGALYCFEEYVQDHLGKLPMEIDVMPEETKGLSEERSLHLFRMLQEILQNALKHSSAKTFVVAGRWEGDVLKVYADDDGIGFDPEDVKARNGAGLRNLATRAQMIGAVLNIHTAPGKGTRYEIQLPLKNEI